MSMTFQSALSKYESEAENKSRRHREWDNYNLRNIYLNETQKKANKETDFDRATGPSVFTYSPRDTP